MIALVSGTPFFKGAYSTHSPAFDSKEPCNNSGKFALSRDTSHSSSFDTLFVDALSCGAAGDVVAKGAAKLKSAINAYGAIIIISSLVQ
ncbi:MAG: hypothetical protein IKC51_07535 [Myxococcaceae bacterium]|nr:hypothetical protein [Myxococcaceae bacterium]